MYILTKRRAAAARPKSDEEINENQKILALLSSPRATIGKFSIIT
jgi:hypothetical protein